MSKNLDKLEQNELIRLFISDAASIDMIDRYMKSDEQKNNFHKKILNMNLEQFYEQDNVKNIIKLSYDQLIPNSELSKCLTKSFGEIKELEGSSYDVGACKINETTLNLIKANLLLFFNILLESNRGPHLLPFDVAAADFKRLLLIYATILLKAEILRGRTFNVKDFFSRNEQCCLINPSNKYSLISCIKD